MSIMADIHEKIHKNGIEAFGRYYGMYYAMVKDNNDPDGGGRIWVACPQIFANDDMLLAPVKPAFMYGSWVPEINEEVLIMFECGDLSRPRYVARNYTTSSPMASELSTANIKGFKTRYGHTILFVDDALPKGDHSEHNQMDKVEDPRIEISTKYGLKAIMSDKEGKERIEFSTPKGRKITLSDETTKTIFEDENGNKIEMTPDGIKLTDAKTNVMEMGASGVKVNGHFLVYKEYLDWLKGAEANFGLGNMGAPVPIFPANVITLEQGIAPNSGKFQSDKAGA